MSRSTARFGPHHVYAKFSNAPRRYNVCQHIHYVNSELIQCGAETLHGKPTCDACKQTEMQGTSGSRYRGIATKTRSRPS